jgi:hypothetical protein
VVAAGASAFLFFSGKNTVSTDNIDLVVQGPTSVAGGDMVPLSIVIANKNPVSLENATLEIDFPAGTRSAQDVTKDYQRYSENVGTITSGMTLSRSVKAVLFGGQGTRVIIPVTLSYGTGGSNATFVKHTEYTLTISTAPLSVSLDSISETVSGKPFTITATVRSNATAPMSGVVLSSAFPNGYLLSSSSISPVGTNFLLGTFLPGTEKKITFTGTLTGQNSDERVFRFIVGTAKSAQDTSLAVSYMTQTANVKIAAPFLAATLKVNGSSVETPVVAPGTNVSVSVSWTNTLPVSVQNASIEVALGGATLNIGSVETQNGFYRSADRTIIFNRDTSPALGMLSPGAKGSGTFTFTTLPTGTSQNASIVLSLSIAGEREGQSGVPEQVTASLSKTIKIASAISLSASSFYTSGPFSNSGPIPPKPNVPTTYSIVWNLMNGGNDIADGSVTATLPSYVTYTGLTSPADGSISFNSSSRTVTWRIGDIPSGSSPQGAFQVSIIPSTSQSGSAPNLTSVPLFSGFDRFAQVQITTQGTAVSTDIKTDVGYMPGKGGVQ